MSKRHRKAKEMVAAVSYAANPLEFAPDYFEAPRGKKPKGKQKRQTLKRAYYDD